MLSDHVRNQTCLYLFQPASLKGKVKSRLSQRRGEEGEAIPVNMKSEVKYKLKP